MDTKEKSHLPADSRSSLNISLRSSFEFHRFAKSIYLCPIFAPFLLVIAFNSINSVTNDSAYRRTHHGEAP